MKSVKAVPQTAEEDLDRNYRQIADLPLNGPFLVTCNKQRAIVHCSTVLELCNKLNLCSTMKIRVSQRPNGPERFVILSSNGIYPFFQTYEVSEIAEIR